jgi:alpha-beta hydrolase superfamily lysophospholipase
MRVGAPATCCIVMGHGFGGTMDRMFETAEGFAKAGLAALPFDYRGFGASGGEPRQVVDIEGQLEDFCAAVAFARKCGGIDPARIALWGNSLGGGHVIVVAARDPRIAASSRRFRSTAFRRAWRDARAGRRERSSSQSWTTRCAAGLGSGRD